MAVKPTSRPIGGFVNRFLIGETLAVMLCSYKGRTFAVTIDKDETYKVITSTEVESYHFGLSSDNPFPCSDIWTGSFWSDGAKIQYRVNEAFGDLGTTEFMQAAA